jgi:hypothetical protein
MATDPFCMIAALTFDGTRNNCNLLDFLVIKRMTTNKSDINWSLCSLEDLESIRDEAVNAIA